MTTITYGIFVEQIKKRLFNNWPSADQSSLTDNEVALYINQSIATVMTSLAGQRYSVEGINSTPEAFVTTYKIALSTATKDTDTNEYVIELPHQPINLPMGYSIQRPRYAKGSGNLSSLIYVDGYAKGFAGNMANKPVGDYCYVEGSKLYITSSTNLITSGWKVLVSMMASRGAGAEEDDTINLPDDTLAMVFDLAVNKLQARLGMPVDHINDGKNDA